MSAKEQKKAAKPEKQEPPKVPAKTTTAVAAVHDYGQDAGAGFEGVNRDDMAIPFLGQIQALSPEAPGGEKEIPGARPGMFFNSVTRDLYADEKGILLVPCLRQHVVVEWVPRAKGGGFVAIHQPESAVVVEAKKRANGSLKLETASGNELQDTFYLFCMVLDSVDDLEPSAYVVVPFTKTKIKRYRNAITQLRSLKGKPPLYAFRLLMSATKETNAAKQPYFNVNLAPAVGTKMEDCLIPPKTEDGQLHPLIAAGRGFKEAIEGGAVKVDHEKQGNEPTGATAGADEEF